MKLQKPLTLRAIALAAWTGGILLLATGGSNASPSDVCANFQRELAKTLGRAAEATYVNRCWQYFSSKDKYDSAQKSKTTTKEISQEYRQALQAYVQASVDVWPQAPNQCKGFPDVGACRRYLALKTAYDISKKYNVLSSEFADEYAKAYKAYVAAAAKR